MKMPPANVNANLSMFETTASSFLILLGSDYHTYFEN